MQKHNLITRSKLKLKLTVSLHVRTSTSTSTLYMCALRVPGLAAGISNYMVSNSAVDISFSFRYQYQYAYQYQYQPSSSSSAAVATFCGVGFGVGFGLGVVYTGLGVDWRSFCAGFSFAECWRELQCCVERFAVCDALMLALLVALNLFKSVAAVASELMPLSQR